MIHLLRRISARTGDKRPRQSVAAEAAEFAAAYGSFWKMHDILFENQEYLQDELLVGLAAQIGLSAHKLRRSLESEIYRGRIELDFRGGNSVRSEWDPDFLSQWRPSRWLL